MAEDFRTLDWIKSFYDVLDETINKNVAAARVVINFSSGFLGVVAAGASYLVSQHPEWCEPQRSLFVLASAMAFGSFFASVTFAFVYALGHRRVIFLPTLPDGITLFTNIKVEQTLDFEQARYEAYKKLVTRGPKIKKLYSLGFAFMLAGFGFYGIAAALLIIFEIGAY